ncbi:STAS domain-containing protein [Kitasatospora sp. NPDC051914]|uniref:STAS domain-containing protein n=1 Tax=Kitasatospora sp. NPDC051914 TaxID=3154945 RepID=UPI00343ACAB2
MDTELRVTPRPAPPGVRMLAVVGQVDMDSAGLLAGALEEALNSPPAPDTLVVDCSALAFCTSAGLNELLRARLAAVAAGVAFRLASPTPRMSRLLRVTEADTVLDIDTAEQPPVKDGC